MRFTDHFINHRMNSYVKYFQDQIKGALSISKRLHVTDIVHYLLVKFSTQLNCESTYVDIRYIFLQSTETLRTYRASFTLNLLFILSHLMSIKVVNLAPDCKPVE